MRVLDLFSGIGGFSLGLERAGMRTVAFCEIDPYCRAVLHNHWPEVPIFNDVRDIQAFRADIVCGGFPCQDISLAGKGAGLAGNRSGLWSEFSRIIGLVRPDYAIVENVAALLGRGLGTILGDLATLGYDAWWDCIPACAVGAPHRRDRIWIVAYPSSTGLEGIGKRSEADRAPGNDARSIAGGVPAAPAFADAIGRSLAQSRVDSGMGRGESPTRNGYWPVVAEPFVRRGSHGIPSRMDRLRSLGNAVVPQIPEIIGRAIMAAESQSISGAERE